MTRRYSLGAKCIPLLLGVMLALSSCRVNCCADVTAQLAGVTVCADFAVTDCGTCGECTQALIDARLMALDCGAWQTQPPPWGGCTWRVTMGEATP